MNFKLLFSILFLLSIFSKDAKSQCSVSINPQGPLTICSGDSLQLTASSTGGGMVLDQSQIIYNGGTSARHLPGYSHWQSFTAGITGTLMQIDLGFFTYINGIGTLNIFAGTGTGGTLLQTQNIGVYCSGGNCTISYPVNAPVVSGQVYTFQFIPGIGMPDPYGVQVQVPGTYPGGEMAIVDPSGTTLTGFDMVFKTYVGTNLFLSWSTGETDSVLMVNSSGNYVVTVTDSAGCTSSDSVSVNVIAAPLVELGDDTTLCNGASIVLNAGSGNLNYLWSDGSTDSTLTVSNAGVYFVQVTNGTSCIATDSIVISTTNCSPIVSFSTSDTAFCEKQCIDFFDQSTNNPISWSWYFYGALPDTSTLQNPTGICYNSYGSFDVLLIVCNQFSCDSLLLTNMIHEYPNPSDSIYQSSDTLYSMPADFYQWYEVTGGLIPGAVNQYYVPSQLQAGSYFCVTTNSIGCISSSNIISITTAVENLNSDYRILIYPNPAVNTIIIEWFAGTRTMDRANRKLEIYDLVGRKIKSLPLHLSPSFGGVGEADISDLAAGNYVIKIFDGENLKTIQRLVKVKE